MGVGKLGRECEVGKGLHVEAKEDAAMAVTKLITSGIQLGHSLNQHKTEN
jgi:hypothetical protein